MLPWRGEKKSGQASHRYNRLPLLPSGPGGVQRELVVPPTGRKGSAIFHFAKPSLAIYSLICPADSGGI